MRKEYRFQEHETKRQRSSQRPERAPILLSEARSACRQPTSPALSSQRRKAAPARRASDPPLERGQEQDAPTQERPSPPCVRRSACQEDDTECLLARRLLQERAIGNWCETGRQCLPV